MGYLKSLERDGPHDGVVALKSETFIIEGWQQPNVTIAGVLAGHEYLFPSTGLYWPIRQIITYASTALNVVTQLGSSPTPASLASWMMTLREPDGTFIVRDMPLSCFNAQLNRSMAARLFGGDMILDPRQSFVYTTVDGLNAAGLADSPVIQFVYQP